VPSPEVSPAVKPEIVAKEISLTPGGRVYVQLQPARVGESTLVIAVLDSASKPWDVPEVTATLSLAAQDAAVQDRATQDRATQVIGPLPVTLRKVRPGDYTSEGLTIPMAGTWQLRIGVRTSEIDRVTVDTTLSVS
jgi:copper transport protein